MCEPPLPVQSLLPLSVYFWFGCSSRYRLSLSPRLSGSMCLPLGEPSLSVGLLVCVGVVVGVRVSLSLRLSSVRRPEGLVTTEDEPHTLTGYALGTRGCASQPAMACRVVCLAGHRLRRAGTTRDKDGVSGGGGNGRRG